MRYTISKSDYMLWLKHPAWLWLKKHHPKSLPPIDQDTQAIFDAGHLFEEYAEGLFDNPLKLGFDSYQEYLSLPDRTRKALDSSTKQAILQGRVEQDSLTCIFDVLEPLESGGYNLYEIKSSTKPKPEHYQDLAFQKLVLEKSGLKIDKIYLIHLNSFFVKKRDKIDPKKLTKVVEVTAEVLELSSQTAQNVALVKATASQIDSPDLSPAFASKYGLRDWLTIYKYLEPNLPEDSIYNLYGISLEQVQSAKETNTQKIEDLDPKLLIRSKQKQQYQAWRQPSPIVDKARIKDFLDQMVFPLYFLDYETMGSVIPILNGTKPYQQIPFQYSLDILESESSQLKHYNYLHTENTNPSSELSQALLSEIGSKGTILAWNMGFEQKCNQTLAKLSSDHELGLLGLNPRFMDLMQPFMEGWYIDKRFMGSASIKKVLPVLVPELSYQELAINQGASAQRVWMETVIGGKHQERREEIFSDLIKYCNLDTYAMVEIYRFLARLVLVDNETILGQGNPPIKSSPATIQGSLFGG
ncbi:DUF2779 domain-containing protein [Candidatus Saccharibacteria bacterium]|nr:DUF2779 domain-containing protein [Candidatus Saccharibacteria bacterium]MCB9834496.1 DUF2779 domain-containing protein [Candidatus Nomurabacteria bacterium]